MYIKLFANRYGNRIFKEECYLAHLVYTLNGEIFTDRDGENLAYLNSMAIKHSFSDSWSKRSILLHLESQNETNPNHITPPLYFDPILELQLGPCFIWVKEQYYEKLDW